MIKLSSSAPAPLLAAYGADVGDVIAEETRDGVAFVSVLFASVELCGIPALWIEEVK